MSSELNSDHQLFQVLNEIMSEYIMVHGWSVADWDGSSSVSSENEEKKGSRGLFVF